MDKYVFVTTTHNWADEFNIGGCFVAIDSEFQAIMDKIQAAFAKGFITEDTEFYFGTNEGLSFENWEDFLSGVQVEECSKPFYDEFQIMCPYGVGFDVIDNMLDTIADSEYDLDESQR
jgi:hypothetical protein